VSQVLEAMNKTEAGELLRSRLNSWRTRSYQELAALIGESYAFEAKGPSGTQYQGSIRVFWDGEADGDVRVIGSIDDGGWRAFVPLSDSFIMAPDGSFVGE
jgi:hypothetical protein